MTLRRIVSGGQTGVDRAALIVGRDMGMAIGGWCPRGRRAEDGMIPRHFPLTETESQRYEQRTRWNVRDSDGTLILNPGGAQAMTGGTALTARSARQLDRPVLVVDPSDEDAAGRTTEWLQAHQIATLNVAGPRASQADGIERVATTFLRRLLAAASPPVE